MAAPTRDGAAGAPARGTGGSRLDPLRPVLEELTAATDVDEGALVAAVEAAVAQTVGRLDPDAAAVSVRFDPVGGALRVERRDAGGAAVAVTLGAEAQRQAAVAVRGAVTALIREAERSRVIREGETRRGELVDAIVERLEAGVWWLRVGDHVAMLPAEEQLPGEVLERNAHLKVLVLEVRRRQHDAVLVVSRSHPGLLRRLLEQEVPEMATGQVLVRGLVRDPGRRSKVAVDAPGGAVDPEGACIGPRGVRIRAVVAELGEEQVHVVGWSADPATLVARALGPAQVLAVELDEETRTAHVTVPQGQLSLAIGRTGENARLAARLSGWRIDIRGEDEPS